MGFENDWTPNEISTRSFKGALSGFNRTEVRDFLAALAQQWAKALSQQQALKDRVHALEKEIAGWEQKEKDLSELRERALLEAQAIREQARSESERLLVETENQASNIRNKTEGWLEEVIARVEETQRQKQNFLSAFRSALDSHYELIKTEEEESEPLSAKLSDVLRKSNSPALI